ncbi:MAG: hypothetical protein NT099_06855 [Candidatus Saganbacteria bacterium]|nr:hypothetical protein [Candidatus Saganbacteria bacterium]
MGINVKLDFEQWTLSYSGMIGNINAPYWFCGIEYGGKDKESRKDNYFRDEYNKYINQDRPDYVNEDFKNKYPDYKNWPVWRKIAKLVLFIKGDATNSLEYHKDKLFNGKGDTFLMNLYPLDFARHDDAFDNLDIQATGLKNRDEYALWCRLNRFPKLRELFLKSKAKCLVCYSKRNKMDFLSIFQVNDINKESVSSIDINDSSITCFQVNGKWVFLIPFLGQGGLMSDDSLKKLGELIRSKIS